MVDLFPTTPTPQHTLLEGTAVLLGNVEFFNFVDDRWVFTIHRGTLYFADSTLRKVDGLKLIAFHDCPPPSRRRGAATAAAAVSCFEGPPGTSPLILQNWDEDRSPLRPRGYCFFTKAVCKKRKYRLYCKHAIVHVDAVRYLIQHLYVELVYNRID